MLTIKVDSLAELKFDPIFSVKLTEFFSLSVLREIIDHLTLKVESLAELKFDLG